MRIHVVSTKQGADGHLYVTFEASPGRAVARWSSKRYKPEIGRSYDVELDADTAADRQTNTNTGRTDVRSLRFENDEVVVEGSVESIDDDGLAYVRLSDDCLLMIETAGAFSAGEALRIILPAQALSVTPTGIV
jgi:hypothetical protein